MSTPPADWISRDLQRLDAAGMLARKPTEEEWNEIWQAANAWAEKEEDDGEGADIVDFILRHAPDILDPEWSEVLIDERAEAGLKPIVPLRRAKPTATRAAPMPVERRGTIKSKSEFAGVGALIQLAGVLLLFAFPIGTVAGVILIIIGSQKSKVHQCSECASKVQKEAKLCPHCRTVF